MFKMTSYFIQKEKEEDVLLHPAECGDIKKHIHEKIRKHIGECTKEDGFVCDIQEIEILKENIISRVTGDVFFKAKYKYTTLKPEIGHVYEAKVLQKFEEGLFCEFQGIRIFVPFDTDVQIDLKIPIRVEIRNIRYEDRHYQCIGHYLPHLEEE